MVSNFSVLPIRWVLTLNSEKAFCPFHSLTEGVLVFFETRVVQQKFIAELVNCKVNFTRKTDITLIAL